MSREKQHLRVIGPKESIRRRRPGLAFVFVLLYAALFGVALWYLGVRTGIWKRKSAPRALAASSASITTTSAKFGHGDAATRGRGEKGRGMDAASRDALLGGEGVARAGKGSYFSRLATERCDCGCRRTLSDCLVNEKSCSHSPELAKMIRETVNAKRKTTP